MGEPIEIMLERLAAWEARIAAAFAEMAKPQGQEPVKYGQQATLARFGDPVSKEDLMHKSEYGGRPDGK